MKVMGNSGPDPLKRGKERGYTLKNRIIEANLRRADENRLYDGSLCPGRSQGLA